MLAMDVQQIGKTCEVVGQIGAVCGFHSRRTTKLRNNFSEIGSKLGPQIEGAWIVRATELLGVGKALGTKRGSFW